MQGQCPVCDKYFPSKSLEKHVMRHCAPPCLAPSFASPSVRCRTCRRLESDVGLSGVSRSISPTKKTCPIDKVGFRHGSRYLHRLDASEHAVLCPRDTPLDHVAVAHSFSCRRPRRALTRYSPTRRRLVARILLTSSGSSASGSARRGHSSSCFRSLACPRMSRNRRCPWECRPPA